MNHKNPGCTERNAKGFSLIELLIVVAIILIIAAIAIPNFLRARISAHESSAVSSLRTINTSETAYSTTYGAGYGTLAQLSTPAIPCAATAAAACLLDPQLSLGNKSGYTFAAAPGSPTSTFAGNAVPVSLGNTGLRSFCVDETGVLRVDSTGTAAPVTDAACQALTTLQ